jgi:membrane fusion protein, copper/silver efflux system
MACLIVFVSVLFTACKENKHNQHDAIAEEYYTCPMHPSVRSNTPGSCPICNMTLVKVETKASAHARHGANIIVIDEHEQRLAGIKTDTVRAMNVFPSSTMLGKVALDEDEVKTISSRVNGRIENLFVKATGGFINKGAALYSIYSEQLLADVKEYLALSEKKRNLAVANEMLNGSKNKLVLTGLSEKQISDLEHSGSANAIILFYSPVSGYVAEVKIAEGMYVDQGSTLLKISSLKTVWVEAQVYSNDLNKISPEEAINIYTQDKPGEVYHGKIIYNSPLLEEGKKVQLLRIRIDNKEKKLIPGMMVYVSPVKTSTKVLAVPESAVINEKMKIAWVKIAKDTFEQRMVETGIENKDFTEITSGIKEGEVIVVSGTYLINSQYILKQGAAARHNH